MLGQVMLTATANFGLSLPAHQRPSYIQVSSCGYTVRPVARAIKIKHAGLDLETWATSYKLDKSQAVGYYKIRK